MTRCSSTSPPSATPSPRLPPTEHDRGGPANPAPACPGRRRYPDRSVDEPGFRRRGRDDGLADAVRGVPRRGAHRVMNADHLRYEKLVTDLVTRAVLRPAAPTPR